MLFMASKKDTSTKKILHAMLLWGIVQAECNFLTFFFACPRKLSSEFEESEMKVVS